MNWDALIKPHASIIEPERQRRARLLSALLLIFMLAAIIGIPLAILLDYTIPATILIVAATLIILILYWLSRSRFYSMVAILTIITIQMTVLSVSLINHFPESLNYLILGLVVSSLYLPPRYTIITSVVTIISIMLIPTIDPSIPFSPAIVNKAFIVGLMGILATVTASLQILDIQHINLQSKELAADLLERVRLFDDAKRRLKDVQALREIDLTIIANNDLHVTLDCVLNKVQTCLGVDAACVLLLNLCGMELEFYQGNGFFTKALELTKLRIGEGFAGRAAQEGRTIFIPDLRVPGIDVHRKPAMQAEGFIAYYAVPLMAKGEIKGVLEVFHRSALEKDAEWVGFLETLAGQAAIAVDNASLFTNLQSINLELMQAYDASIEGWSRALDLRDRETEGHTQRVTELTSRLAHMMDIPESELVHIRRGTLLHDIGKMGIPDQILLKPGPLTDEEWGVMRKHPIYAYEMLAPISYLQPALDIPFSHHEKWDGTGYPNQLKGEQIPLAARIFSVIDVWDALTSDRPYRQAWSCEKALTYIKEQSGKQFDPQIVELFLYFIKQDRDNNPPD